jgi:hypothetical protein
MNLNPSDRPSVLRGQRVVGGVLCHSTGLPGGGRDLGLCHILIGVHTA